MSIALTPRFVRWSSPRRSACPRCLGPHPARSLLRRECIHQYVTQYQPTRRGLYPATQPPSMRRHKNRKAPGEGPIWAAGYALMTCAHGTNGCAGTPSRPFLRRTATVLSLLRTTFLPCFRLTNRWRLRIRRLPHVDRGALRCRVNALWRSHYVRRHRMRSEGLELVARKFPWHRRRCKR